MGKESLRIAPKGRWKHWTVEDYQKIDFSKEDGWQKAIDIFEARIRGRFLNIINEIEGVEYAGFSVMAIACLLIETLQQFYEGKPRTPTRESKTYFKRFLTETSFGKYFDKDKAVMFYCKIRCGILHQAEIKGSSKIWIRVGSPLIEYSKDRQGLVINRREFHQQLVKEFEEYVKRLRDENHSKNRELREKFKSKMDFICKVK